MNYKFELTEAMTRVVLDQLDLGTHKVVRPTIEALLIQINDQQEQAEASAMPLEEQEVEKA